MPGQQAPDEAYEQEEFEPLLPSDYEWNNLLSNKIIPLELIPI